MKTKKEQIVSLFSEKNLRPEEIARQVEGTVSYVVNVLREAGYQQNYFDLYTSSEHPMNVYSKIFANRLGFKTLKIAQRSVNFINRYYQMFKRNHDRTGQHHALMVALTMFNRARWIQKREEANLFREWLIHCLNEDIEAPVN
jgi:hypothetical protein